MTKEEILAMEAGRELDKMVAELLFSYRVEDRYGYYDPESGYFCETQSSPLIGERGERQPCILVETKEFRGGVLELWNELPCYSTDISPAWQVVEKMLSEGWYWFAYGRKELGIELNGCQFAKEPFIKDNIDYLVDKIVDGKFQMPEAICKAALLTNLEGGKI